jgi:hypothetical protein
MNLLIANWPSFLFPKDGLRALIWRCQELKNEFQAAGTMCPNRLSGGVSTGPCKISWFTIGTWLRFGRCSTTRAKSRR